MKSHHHLLSALTLLLFASSCVNEEPAPPACTTPDGDYSADAYGGDLRVQLDATGFFRTQKLCERWWFVTPDGHPFQSYGVNSTRPNGDRNQETGEYAYRDSVTAIYKNNEAWADATKERLRSWGFTTIGSWSDYGLFMERMPLTINLSLADDDWISGEVADYFEPSWVESVDQRAVDVVTPLAPETNIIGFFLDNEIRWGPDWRDFDTLLVSYLKLPEDAAGKAVAVDLLLDELGGLKGVNQLLGTDLGSAEELLASVDSWAALEDDTPSAAELSSKFLELVADQYFRVITSAIRQVDTNHLILGNREVSVMTRREVFEAAAAYVDVLSINNYVFIDGVAEAAMTLSGSMDPADGFAALHALIDLPILITEFGFRADDSGLPNSWPPIYPSYPTQQERTEAFTDYARRHQAVPWIVGYHWFEWVDQPQGGRFDGENNNWGLVNEQDQPYQMLTQAMAQVNAEIWGRVELDP